MPSADTLRAPSQKKKRKAKSEGEPAGPSNLASTVNQPKEGRSSADGKKKKCQSSFKGDYTYETCGAFCKAAKAKNHCLFCKCKTCAFCGGLAGSTRPSSGRARDAGTHGASKPKKAPMKANPGTKALDAASARPPLTDATAATLPAATPPAAAATLETVTREQPTLAATNPAHTTPAATTPVATTPAAVTPIAATSTYTAANAARGTVRPVPLPATGGSSTRDSMVPPKRTRSRSQHSTFGWFWPILLCGIVACWLVSRHMHDGDTGGIPGFGSGRVRAEHATGYERSSFLRGQRSQEDDEHEAATLASGPGLDGAFSDVEKLEERLRSKPPAE